MNTFLKRLMIFCIPLLVYCVVIAAIDPYNYFRKNHLISDDIKLKVINRSPKSMPRGNALWKYNEFAKKPKKNIIIGDSRAFDINVDKIKEIAHDDYFNFGVPGGNYLSLSETFWYAAGKTDLKKVYLQISFHTYSSKNNHNLITEAQKVFDHPYLFFSRAYFFAESMLDLGYSLLDVNIDKTHEEKKNATIWNQILKQQGEGSLTNMVYTEDYLNNLKEIVSYCSKNHIELYFIIFPDQKDFHDLISKYDLDDEYQKYKNDIHSLGKVYDFDSPASVIYSDRNNYRDIFHLNLNLIDDFIIPAIWGGEQFTLSVNNSGKLPI